jgi:hypothetical protein
MNLIPQGKIGGISLIIGSILFALYSLMFPILLPINNNYDAARVALDPYWIPLAITVFIGILMQIGGFYSVYSRIRTKSGAAGTVGFLFIETAYILQACKVTWEIFLYPIIAGHSESAFLLRDSIIKHDPAIVILRITSSLIIFIGIVLFCLVIYRSKEYPKAAPFLIFIGAFIYALGPIITIFVAIAGIFVLSVGCMILGLHLIGSKTE